VQKHIANLSGSLRHENARAWKASHCHRQRADVILMRMRNQNSFDLGIGDCLELRQRILPGVLWMHSAIEHQLVTANLKIVRVRADFRAAREVNKFQMRLSLAQSLNFYQTANSLNSRFREQSKYWSHERRNAAGARAKQPSRAGHLHRHLHCLLRNGRRLSDRYWIDSRCHHTRDRDTLADDLLATDALLFLISCLLSYRALRSRGLRRMHRLKRIADAIFIVAMIGMVVVCALITYTISVPAR
jgi:hypothetical protein